MSSEHKKGKLGFSKYRLLLWLIILMGVWALFNAGLNPFVTRYETAGAYFDPKTPKKVRYTHRRSYAEGDFIFIYSKKDRAVEESEKNKPNNPEGEYFKYTVFDEVKGLGHRDHRKASQELAISIYLPIVIILLIMLFEKPIVRKLEKIG